MSSACAGLATATAKIDPLFAEDAPAPARLYRCGTPPPTPAAKIQAMLAPDQGSQAYQDYLAGNDCRVLVKLNEGAVDALLAEAAQSTPPSAMDALRQVTQAALAQIDRIERSARFRSNQDRTLMLAGYYCFVSGAIMSQLPPERQQTITLADFGQTAPCKDAGRTG